VLVGQSGYGVGYVAPSLVRPVQMAAASCRVIDASVATSGQRPSAERYSACRDNRGEWQLTQA
jgi:surface antigen